MGISKPLVSMQLVGANTDTTTSGAESAIGRSFSE
jgi:hypothetical protein